MCVLGEYILNWDSRNDKVSLQRNGSLIIDFQSQ